VAACSATDDSTRCALEDRVLEILRCDHRLAVTIVTHLYDLAAEGPAIARLRSLQGHLVVAAWLAPRATYWLLRRHGIQGVRWKAEDDSARDGTRSADATDGDRRIWCLDLRKYPTAEVCADAVARILPAAGARAASGDKPADAEEFDEPSLPRWYPVVDYDRCVNCLECLNFCLFGVYDLDAAERVVVEQPDACRPGCPACARVCPRGAIMFPEHADATISGDDAPQPEGRLGDVSRLMPVLDPVSLAIAKRASRTPATPTSGSPAAKDPKDPEGSTVEDSRLDDLVDGLDDLDL